jgi:hypothetical protein
MATPLQTFQQVTMGGIEEVMESTPYGIEVSPSFVTIPFLHRLEFIYIPHICMSYSPNYFSQCEISTSRRPLSILPLII